MTENELLEEALDAAVTRHFGTLFEVLMVGGDARAMDRFENGLKKLRAKRAEVLALVKCTETSTPVEPESS